MTGNQLNPPPPAGKKIKNSKKSPVKSGTVRGRLMTKYLAAPHMVWAILFIIAPMLFVGYFAFTDTNGKFTFDNIIALARGEYIYIFIRSMGYAFAATIICLIMAYPIAYFVSRTRPKSQRLLVMLIMLPMWINFIIRTYSLYTIIDTSGIANQLLSKIFVFMENPPQLKIFGTPYAIILGMIYDYLPYMILPIYSVMTKIDNRLIEASHDLGASSFTTMTRVVMPLSISGVVSGIMMVFVPSISTFYISAKLGGGRYVMIGDQIETQFIQNNNWNFGAAMSLVLMILILISITILGRFTDEENGGGLVA